MELIAENKIESLNTMVLHFENDGYSKEVAHEIFSLTYLELKYKEITFYLLHKEYVKPEDLSLTEIKNILTYTSWGLEYIYHNLERVLNRQHIDIVIDIILDHLKYNETTYQKFLDKTLTISNQKIRDKFIEETIKKHIHQQSDFDIKTIVRCLFENPDEFDYQQESLSITSEKPKLVLSELPCFLLSYTKYNKKINNLMLEYFGYFFQAESSKKISILEQFYSKLPISLYGKYTNLFYLYNKQKDSDMDKILTILINSGEYDVVTKFLEGKSFDFYNFGSTTRVFKVDDKVLKFTLEKHEINTEKDLFLMAPTETKVIYDNENNPVLFIEIQKYLNKSYLGVKMTSKDIDNFFNELDRLGYVLTDPRCFSRHFTNFGFLDDYHDANLGEYTSHEDLPEWFKERPIVLYDIDLVYKKDAPNIKTYGTLRKNEISSDE